MQQLQTIASGWFGYMATMFYQSSILIGVILLLYVICARRSATLRYILLCIVLIKFILPPSFSLVTGLGTLASFIDPAMNPKKSLIYVSPSTLVGGPDFKAMDKPVATINLSQSPSSFTAIDNQPIVLPTFFSQSFAIKPSLIFFVLWSGLFVFFAVLFSVRIANMLNYFKHKYIIPNAELSNTIKTMCRELSIKKTVVVYIHPTLHSPVVTGIFNPKIILPKNMLESCSANELKPILYHELAHIKRGDLIVNAVQIVLQVLWFFHPGLWLVNSLIRHEREQACDDIALAHTQVRRKEYASGMLSIVKNFATPYLPVPGLMGLFERKPSVVIRIKRILNLRHAIIHKLSSFELVTVLLAAFFFLPLAQPAFALRLMNMLHPNPAAQGAIEQQSLLHAYRISKAEEAAFSIKANTIAPFWQAWNSISISKIWLTPYGERPNNQASTMHSEFDAQAVIKAAYGDKGIYLLCEVMDDDFAGAISKDYWANDVIDFFFDQHASGELYKRPDDYFFVPGLELTRTSMQVQYAFGKNTPADSIGINVYNPSFIAKENKFTDEVLAGAFKYQVVDVSKAVVEIGLQVHTVHKNEITRYMEWCIPWHLLVAEGSRPAEGKRLAFSIVYADMDSVMLDGVRDGNGNPKPKQISWNGRDNPYNGTGNGCWGDIVLDNKIEPMFVSLK